VHQFAFARNPHFTLVGDGENYIDAMYSADAIKALMAVLLYPAQDGFRCIDLGVGSRESVNQVVIRAAHAFGLEAQLHHDGSTAEYIQFSIDPQPFATTYQFKPVIPLEEGLQLLADHLVREENILV
jgi:nucleoside-diphosphate-sugar epimerase